MPNEVKKDIKDESSIMDRVLEKMRKMFEPSAQQEEDKAKDISKSPAMTPEELQRKRDAEDMAKIMGGNYN